MTAKVHSKDPQDDCYQEIEMRLRSQLSAKVCSGYEITFKTGQMSDAYLIIVRWNGPVGDFTYLLNSMGSQYGVTEGDEVKATIVGNLITAFKNGVEMGHATDDTYANGAPGMGFNLETSDASCRGPMATTASPSSLPTPSELHIPGLAIQSSTQRCVETPLPS